MKSKTQRLKSSKVWLACLLAIALAIPAGTGAAFAENNEIAEEEEMVALEQIVEESEETEGQESETEPPVAEEELVEEVVESEDAIVEEAIEVEGEETKQPEEGIEGEVEISIDEQIDLINMEEETQAATEELVVGAAASEEEVLPQSDISGQLADLEWNIYRASDDIEPSRDLGSDPANYPTDVGYRVEYYVKMTFDINAPVSDTLHEGDTLVVPFLPSDWLFADTVEEDLLAGDGITVLGTWKISGKTIIITLGEKAEGQSALMNCQITTAKNILSSNLQYASDVVMTSKIGTVTHTYKVKKHNRGPGSSRFDKAASISSNNRVDWFLGHGNDLVNNLYLNDGASISPHQTSFVLEDEIPASEGIVDLELKLVNARVLFVMSETDKRAAMIMGAPALEGRITWKFKKVEQLENESYSDFKLRIDAFNYGIYKMSDGGFKFVINYGDYMSPDHPLKYSDVWPDLENSLKTSGKVTDKEAEIIAHSLRDDNAVHGNVIAYACMLDATYQQAFVGTKKNNTAYATQTRDGVESSIPRSASATLQAGSAVATPAAQSATIAKADSISGQGLGGVTFKLQFSTTETGTYSDTTYGPNSNGTFVTSSANDATKGTVNTGTLSPGWYRFVEVSGLDGYVGTYTSDPFQITGGGAGVVVTATNTPIDYTVKYDTNGATSPAIADKINVRYWDANLLPDSTPVKPGYIFQGWKLSKRADTALSATDIKNGSAVTNSEKYQDLALAEKDSHPMATSESSAGVINACADAILVKTVKEVL